MAASMLRFAAKRCIFAPRLIQRASFVQPLAKISTSKDQKDIAAVQEPAGVNQPWQKEVEDEVAKSTKNWMSYGYSLTDRDEDQFHHIVTMFLSISVLLVGGAFVMAYYPDYKFRDWTTREAFMELALREKEGRPLVDRDYIPEEVMLAQLPSEEELGDTDLII